MIQVISLLILQLAYNCFTESSNVETVLSNSELKCVAILPGIGIYDESSDSDSSIDSEELVEKVQFDLCGRPVDGDNHK